MIKNLLANGRTSRSSSSHSITRGEELDPMDITAIVTETVRPAAELAASEIGSLPDTTAEDEMPHADMHFTYTQNHPLGKVLIDHTKDLFNLHRRSGAKEMESCLEDLSENFHQSMRLFRQDIAKQIERSQKNFEVHLIQKELNSHLLNDDADPPKHFSPVPTLLTPALRNEAMKNFPTRSPRFSGLSPKEGGVDIIEFLSAMNNAQEYCLLSEKEFKQLLLACTTGRAHTLLVEWIRLGDNISTLYHNLVMHFDSRIPPEQAKELLFTYKAPKNATLRDVEVLISDWATRASRVLPDGASRTNYYNSEAVHSLIRSLPPASAARVQSVYNSLSARLGRAATASELTRALNLDRHSIDKDIKQHGADRHSNIGYQSRFRKPKPRVYGVVAAIPQHMREDRSNSQSKRKNREARSSRDASIVRRVHQLSINGNGMGQANNSAYPEKRRFDRSNSRNRSIPESKRSYYNDSRSRRGFKPRYSEHKNYCSLCGKKDHLAKDKCPYMVDESGRQIDIMPVQQTCTLCPENVRPRLNHPEALCPYRKGGPFRKH